MTNASNVTTLKTATKVKRVSKPKSDALQVKKTSHAHHTSKAMRRLQTFGYVIGGVALTITAVSLSHLAHGVEMVTHCDTWESYAMAIGIDAGFVSLELAMLTSPDDVRGKLGCYANPMIIGTLILSAIMNALVFSSNSVGLGWQIGACLLGLAIPAGIYLMTKAAAIAILGHK